MNRNNIYHYLNIKNIDDFSEQLIIECEKEVKELSLF